MKKFCLSMMFMAIVGLSTVPAWAIPPFADGFKKKYVEGNSSKEFVDAVGAAKCNVCHKGEKKKDKNEYGDALAKHLKKADFTGDSKKFDPKSDEGQKAIKEGLEKTEAEKSSSGKTFGELLKSGKLPG